MSNNNVRPATLPLFEGETFNLPLSPGLRARLDTLGAISSAPDQLAGLGLLVVAWVPPTREELSELVERRMGGKPSPAAEAVKAYADQVPEEDWERMLLPDVVSGLWAAWHELVERAAQAAYADEESDEAEELAREVVRETQRLALVTVGVTWLRLETAKDIGAGPIRSELLNFMDPANSSPSEEERGGRSALQALCTWVMEDSEKEPPFEYWEVKASQGFFGFPWWLGRRPF